VAAAPAQRQADTTPGPDHAGAPAVAAPLAAIDAARVRGRPFPVDVGGVVERRDPLAEHHGGRAGAGRLAHAGGGGADGGLEVGCGRERSVMRCRAPSTA
jgi:hypothetical protein